jgi:hypothetical protein
MHDITILRYGSMEFCVFIFREGPQRRTRSCKRRRKIKVIARKGNLVPTTNKIDAKLK